MLVRRGIRPMAAAVGLAALVGLITAVLAEPAGAAVIATETDDGSTPRVEGSVLSSALGAGCGWAVPVDAAIVEGFVAPANPFGPGGNRGIEYATVQGQPVHAVADGRVSFAGPVGGRRWIVVAHDSGLRSTYGPLASASVVRGQAVSVGGELGLAQEGFHLTARSGDRYLDPAPLLAGRCGRPRLVPVADR